MGGNKSRKKSCKHTLLKWLQALECDLKKVLVGEPGGVVGHIDAEKRDDRHFEFVFQNKIKQLNPEKRESVCVSECV